MTSFQSQVFAFLLRRLAKPIMADEFKSRKRISAPKGNPAPPKRLSQCKVAMRTVAGFPCYSLSPLTQPVKQTVIYLHGGAYVIEIRKEHWAFINRIVTETGCRVEVPIYGLAPAFTYREAFPFLMAVYRDIIERFPEHGLTIMGDSAGGGLGLALTQSLVELNMPLPNKLVLLAPWLDLSLSNPDIAALEARDPFLSRKGLVLAGQAWAGEDSLLNPQVSPIYGELKGLPPIDLYVGTHDILLADCRRFRDLAASAGIQLNYKEEAGAFHVYPLAPVPEGRLAASRIMATLSENLRKAKRTGAACQPLL
jgi:monoterpene epsilon-lactone hydrolase